MVEDAKDRDIRQSDGKLTLIKRQFRFLIINQCGWCLYRTYIYFVNLYRTQDVIGSNFSAMNFGCKK